MKLKEFKKEFADRQGIHFNCAGRSPISRSAADAIRAAAESSAREASLADHAWVLELGRMRKNLADFLGADSADVAFTPNVATALSQAALGFPLQPGDEVVTLDQEYASNYYPWKTACERAGAKFTVVESGSAFASGPDLSQKVIEAIRPGVKVVAVSWVQFQTGAVLDLKAIGERAHSVGAFFVVDGIQGLGQLPFSFNALPVDFVAGGSHKWLCGPLGQGFLAVKPEWRERLQPTVVGGGTFNRFGTFADPEAIMESSARKFEPGGMGFIALFGFDAAVSVIRKAGVEEIAREISRLSRILREKLQDLPVQRVTPINQPGGITSFKLPPEPEAQFLTWCRENQIAIAKRGEFIRLSIHAFSEESEIGRLSLGVLLGV